MSGVVVAQDLCSGWVAVVRPGWRGAWPCPGDRELRRQGEVLGLVECTCPCHQGLLCHVLPRLADRTAVHPTDVLASG